jgi:nucleotide-binding universal stress UspA family protein
MMTPDRPSPCVVVGYDGSPASRAALALAVRHARPDGRVVVVHAVKQPIGRYDGVPYQKQLDAVFGRARSLLAHLEDEEPGLGDVEWSTELLAGPPAVALADVAAVERATEIVVGSRGFGRARALLGSVARDLVHHAACPVTVIPERALGARRAERAAGIEAT